MEELMDRVEIERGDGGTTVVLGRKLREAALA
jgi:hypothetical protein